MFSLSDWKLIYKLEAIMYVKEAEKISFPVTYKITPVCNIPFNPL